MHSVIKRTLNCHMRLYIHSPCGYVDICLLYPVWMSALEISKDGSKIYCLRPTLVSVDLDYLNCSSQHLSSYYKVLDWHCIAWEDDVKRLKF